MTENQKAFILALADLLEEHQLFLSHGYESTWITDTQGSEIADIPDWFDYDKDITRQPALLRKLVEQ